MSHFRITYDGPALVAHEMDVRELAPALLAIGDLLDAATRALKGTTVKPRINVKASFKTGFFGIDYILVTDWVTTVRDMFASDSASSAANAAEILAALGFVAYKGKHGLIYVLKWLRGRKIVKVETGETTAQIYTADEHIEVEVSVLTLLRDIAVRESLDKALAPLDKEGIDTFACGTDDEIIEVISVSERRWFRAPILEEELLLDDERKMVFSIVTLAFREANKWRLYDGASTIHATITDSSFLDKVDQNAESFSKGM